MRSPRSVAVLVFLLANVATACAQDLSGDWATQGYSARVRIAPCTLSPTLLCGEITWLWDPTDAKGEPLTDARNSMVALRDKPLIGLQLLKGFRQATATNWIDGTIYDPESGRTYRSTLTQRTPDLLEVSGCVLFVCRTQLWRRAATLCPPQSLISLTPSNRQETR